jgi:hypothetical protein
MLLQEEESLANSWELTLKVLFFGDVMQGSFIILYLFAESESFGGSESRSERRCTDLELISAESKRVSTSAVLALLLPGIIWACSPSFPVALPCGTERKIVFSVTWHEQPRRRCWVQMLSRDARIIDFKWHACPGD